MKKRDCSEVKSSLVRNNGELSMFSHWHVSDPTFEYQQVTAAESDTYACPDDVIYIFFFLQRRNVKILTILETKSAIYQKLGLSVLSR